jgi:hypothetical protein
MTVTWIPTSYQPAGPRLALVRLKIHICSHRPAIDRRLAPARRHINSVLVLDVCGCAWATSGNASLSGCGRAARDRRLAAESQRAIHLAIQYQWKPGRNGHANDRNHHGNIRHQHGNDPDTGSVRWRWRREWRRGSATDSNQHAYTDTAGALSGPYAISRAL